MSIENAVVARIGALATAAGTRVYRELVAQEPTLPVVVVTRTAGGPRRAFGGAEIMTRAELAIEIIGDTLAQVGAVADAIRIGLNGWNGAGSGVTVLQTVMNGQGEGSTADGDTVIRIMRLDYSIVYR